MSQDNSGDEPKKPKLISSAPPPITPLRGSYYSAKPKEPDVRKPDWGFWTKIKAVNLWQAVALSLDIDPDGMKHSRSAWMAGPGSGPIFESRSFPSEATKIEYDKRLRLLKPEITNTACFHLVKIVPGNRADCEIYLRDFAKWAQAIDLGAMPPELMALATVSCNEAPSKFQHNEPTEASQRDGEGLKKREKQIRAIESVVDKLEYPRLAIPEGGKKTVQAECRKEHSDLFGAGEDPFKEAWQEAVTANRIRTKNHNKYSKGK